MCSCTDSEASCSGHPKSAYDFKNNLFLNSDYLSIIITFRLHLSIIYKNKYIFMLTLVWYPVKLKTGSRHIFFERGSRGQTLIRPLQVPGNPVYTKGHEKKKVISGGGGAVAAARLGTAQEKTVERTMPYKRFLGSTRYSGTGLEVYFKSARCYNKKTDQHRQVLIRGI